MILFHTGFDEIRIPDLLQGRKNADFGQGFYLSDSGEFAGKWAKERKDRDVVINTYELDLTGLDLGSPTIVCLSGSTAEEYAKAHDLFYVYRTE